MIELRDLSKVFRLNGQTREVLKPTSMVFPPGRSVGLLGRNGAGKSTLLRMISGNIEPTTGEVIRHGSVSFPVGFAGSFHGELTGAQNARFVARIYGVDADELVEFTNDFAELGRQFHLPFRTYSSGMRARLAFGVSMGIAFDTYLVDEVTAVGDAAFKEKSKLLFKDRMRNAGAVMVTHSMGQIREECDAAVVLEEGNLTWFDDVEEAIAHHQRNMLGPGAAGGRRALR
jgi:capsular polysaccharide transport system ATP-binding protein